MGKLLHAARKLTRYCCIISVVLSNKISCYMLMRHAQFPMWQNAKNDSVATLYIHLVYGHFDNKIPYNHTRIHHNRH